MFPATQEKLATLKATDLNALAELDSRGLLIAPGETLDEFKKRLTGMAESYAAFEEELKEQDEILLFECITVEDGSRIPKSIMKEAAEIDYQHYQFSIDWVPGFFLSESLSFMWGGCAISSPETMLSLFLIRKSFKTRKKWYLYTREELLSHEISHVARTPLADRKFEEHFAYQLSPSKLRRHFGSCFQTGLDAVLFLFPVFLLLIMTIIKTIFSLGFPMWPFWILICLYPAFMILRNELMHHSIRRASFNMQAAGFKSHEAILYRCNSEEIEAIAGLSGNNLRDWLAEKTAGELRWQVINHRFIVNNDGE